MRYASCIGLVLMLTMTNCAENKQPTGIDRANLDETVAPGKDFYDYACGGWMKAHPLTAEYSRYGTFDALGELNREQVLDLITNLDRNSSPNAQKIADLYAQGMDSVTLNQQGNAPLASDLKMIAEVDKESMFPLLATMPGASGFFDTGVEADMLNADLNTMYLMQGGLGLGDRDYYIVDGNDEKKVREAYTKYLTDISVLAGFTPEEAARMASNSMKIETALAQASSTREALRDPMANYNPTAISVIAESYPNLKMKEYFKAQGIESIDTVVVGQPAFLAAVDKLIASSTEQEIRDYLATQYISSAASYLSDDFFNAEFELSKVISGVQEPRPRWKRASAVPNGMLGEALGQLYVEKYFPASSKEKMLTLVKNLQDALGQHIDSLAWMSDATKKRAHEKLATFHVKVGYPDKWRDYSALIIDPEKSYWENIQAAIKFNNDFNLADYGKPVDKDRWYMTPQTVNAYYNPTTNEICFPAGILQKPFFDPDADDALNYGAIGVVIGHEMTHGFDDQGRQFDKDGNLNDWWTPEDAEAFTALADALAAQFDEVVVLGDTHANGRFTLGENIADQGGLRVAYTAYHNSLPDGTGKDIDGFTPDQRFYLAYANVWAGNIRDEEILRRTKTDPHSLGRWRVNATLRNIAPFFEAFSITEADPMFRPESERVVIW